MTPDGFFAFIGILIAVWAIMPDYRRFHVKLICSWSDYVILGFAFIAILLYFFLLGPEANLNVLAIVLVVSAWGFGRLIFDNKKTKIYNKFFIFSKKLLQACKLTTLARFIPHPVKQKVNQVKSFLIKHANSQHKRKLQAYDFFVNELLQAGKYHDLSKFLLATAHRMVITQNSEFLLEPQGQTEFTGTFIRRIYGNNEYLKYLAVAYPELGFELSRHDGYSSICFQENFLRTLIEVEGSELYHEITTLNIDSMGYKLGDDTPVLKSLFGDMAFAQKREVYRPVGEAMMAELYRLSHSPEIDKYNWDTSGDFDINDFNPSILFVGERYFDVMVTEAIKHNTQWHMWLYYYPHFMRGICKNYLIGPENDPETEFPNRYSYLIYEMFSSMCSWVKAINNINQGQANTKLNAVDLNHENHNIPKSSLIAMKQCLGILLEAKQVPDKFKRYMLKQLLYLYFNLRIEIAHSRSDAHDYAKIILLIFKNLKSNPDWHEHIKNAWCHFDKIPHTHTDLQRQYCNELEEAIL